MCNRLRELPSADEDRRHQDMKSGVERALLRVRGQVEALQQALGIANSDAPGEPEPRNTPGVRDAQTPLRTPQSAGGGTPSRSSGRRRMQLLSASGRPKARGGQAATPLRMATPDASPIVWRPTVSPSPLGVLNNASPAISPFKGTGGKASRVFAGRPTREEEAHAETTLSDALRAVEDELEEQRAACKALNGEF